MALQSQAQLLDELMGKNRNAAPGIKIESTKFDDEDVCKYALCGFCPHDLFVNTRADLGPCTRLHDDALKQQYEKSSRYGRLGYEEELERYIRDLLSDVERKIKRGIERLKLTQSDPNQKTPLQIKQERVAYLKEEINRIMKEAESLGEEGKIEEAQATLESCEKLKSECKYIEIQIDNNASSLDQKQMEVCDVCGSFLIINDAQSRIEEHISGKQHMGYAKLRSALEDIKKKRMEEYEKRRNKDRSSSSQHEKSRDRSRDRSKDRRGDRHDRDRRVERSKDSSRDRRDSRRNESDRRRDRTRSRSRDRIRSKNSEHKRRSRSRSRSKDRKRDRRDDDHKRDDASDGGRRTSSDNHSKSLSKEVDKFMKQADKISSRNHATSEKKSKDPSSEKEEGEDDSSQDEM